jgi:hypothetical protein
MEPVSPPEYVPPGHFCSPIPSREDIERALSDQRGGEAMLGVEFHEKEQLALLDRLARYYPEISFPENKNDQYRYAFNNPSYSWCDAIILYCIMREFRPVRIIEVGSGHTSVHVY